LGFDIGRRKNVSKREGAGEPMSVIHHGDISHLSCTQNCYGVQIKEDERSRACNVDGGSTYKVLIL
jgi:hypothetical protein